jgi:flagellar biosynthetic protein FliO
VDPQPISTPGYGAELAQTLMALAGVCALAWWLLRWGARRGLGALAGPGAGRVEVLERTTLDARRAIFLVRIGARVLVVGAGDQSLSLLTEMRDDELPPPRPAPRSALEALFASVKRAPSTEAPRGEGGA